MDKDLSKLIKDITKDSPGVYVDMSNTIDIPGIEWTPTGILALDTCIGKGLPKGRIIELFGGESGGKSSLSLLAIAANQKLGGRCAYIDAEASFDPVWAERLGVSLDEDKFTLLKPDYGEQALDLVDKMVEANLFDIIVVDSVAALVPKAILENSLEKMTVGAQARLLNDGLKKLTMKASKSKTTIIFLNQIRNKIGVLYGNPEDTPGGKALKFYASVRIKISRVSKSEVMVGEDIVGHRLHIRVPKNKVSQPYREREFLLHYNNGVDNLEEVIHRLEIANKISRAGPMYKININGEEIPFKGLSAFKLGIRTNPTIQTYIKENMDIAQMYQDNLFEDFNDDAAAATEATKE